MANPSESTRDRLLRAAAVEIARYGYKGASLRGVARGADIKAASIFHYFPGGKEELARTLLGHIMETFATRMMPTIDSASGLPPAELIVQCCALLWDFMAERPEYAGALMREAFEPDAAIADLVQGNAARVVSMATAYFEACQTAGTLPPFEVRRFLLRMASYVITFHGAPSMRRYILGEDASIADEREAFLAAIRARVAPGQPRGAAGES